MNTFWDPIEESLDKYSVSLEKLEKDNQAKLNQKPGIIWAEGADAIPEKYQKIAERYMTQFMSQSMNEKNIVRKISPVSAEASIIIEITKQNGWGYRTFATKDKSNAIYDTIGQSRLDINLSNEIWGDLYINQQLFNFYSATGPSTKKFSRVKRKDATFVDSKSTAEKEKGFFASILKAIRENPPISIDMGINSELNPNSFFPEQRLYYFGISNYSKSKTEFSIEPENFLLKHHRDIELESNDFNKMFHISTQNNTDTGNVFEALNPNSMAILIDWTKELGFFEMFYNPRYIAVLSSEGWGEVKHKIIERESPHRFDIIVEDGESQRVKDNITKTLNYSIRFLSSLDFI